MGALGQRGGGGDRSLTFSGRVNLLANLLIKVAIELGRIRKAPCRACFLPYETEYVRAYGNGGDALNPSVKTCTTSMLASTEDGL